MSIEPPGNKQFAHSYSAPQDLYQAKMGTLINLFIEIEIYTHSIE